MGAGAGEDATVRIQRYMDQLFREYRTVLTQCRGADGEKKAVVFWDVVVLTTFDERQRRSFLQQLQPYRDRLPPGTVLEVISDPDGTKLGNGGSTLHVLQHLHYLLGEQKLHSSRVLIIHSGGSSQRLPSYSAQGKIFSPVPVRGLVAGNVAVMLDIKLSLYLPFCRVMPAGVLVTCADDIETYNLPPHWPSQQDAARLHSCDVVALAHPSDLLTGEGHGVYVLQPAHRQGVVVSVESVLEVLQKPSQEAMRCKGAVITADDGSEMVYSDSIFWMSERVYKSLLSWYSLNSPLKQELDAYAHFLPCFGDRMQASAPADKSNGKLSVDAEKRDFRSEMSDILKKFSFNVIVLNESRFYHLGSMKEYIDHFTNIQNFRSELNISDNEHTNLTRPWMLTDVDTTGSSEQSQLNRIIIGTFFKNESCRIKITREDHAVVEWSNIGMPLTMPNNVIVSNCEIDTCPEVQFTSSSLKLFENCLYHTVPIKESGARFYVTIILNITDNIKHSCADISGIKYFGESLANVLLSCVHYRNGEIVPDDKKLSLWNVRLFPRGSTPVDSFWRSFYLVNCLLHATEKQPMQVSVTLNSKEKLYSLEEVLQLKNLDALLADREDLMTKIRQ
uniref:Fucose-1-phosphate guanylyltransferase-like n=1 Tax=Hirondellea gigas TaxID=1518452 RepID=A0A6A7FVF7_9CRUS